MYATAVSVAVGAVVVIWALSAGGTETRPENLGGDLPAFYGAGRIVADGDWDQLYDQGRQVAAQADLWDDEGSLLYFAYPPFVAAAYRPLAALDFRLAYLAHTLLMGLALWGAVRLVRPMIPWIGSRTVVPFAVALLFYPMFRSVIGGQNASLTLLLVALAARLEFEERPFLAGAAAAMLLYKPQFGLPILLLLLVTRRWRTIAGGAVGSLVLFATGVVAIGWGWIGDWWDQASTFADQNLEANGVNFVSVPGVLAQLADGAAWATVAGGVFIVATGLAVALLWWSGPADTLGRYAVGVAAVVAVAPQALFYEVGVLLFAVAVALQRDRLSGIGVTAIWVAGFAHLAAPALGFSPLVILVVVVLALAIRSMGRPREVSPV